MVWIYFYGPVWDSSMAKCWFPIFKKCHILLVTIGVQLALLLAVFLQGALGIYDLGQFHFKALKDSNGCIVLTTVCNVRDPKSVILSSSKWVSFAKLLRRSSGTGSEPQESLEVLVSSVSVSHTSWSHGKLLGDWLYKSCTCRCKIPYWF